MPSPGTVTQLFAPSGSGVRFDSHLYPGYEIPSYYDSLIGVYLSWSNTPTSHCQDHTCAGWANHWRYKTNIPLHRDVILADESFATEAQNIHYLEKSYWLLIKKKRHHDLYIVMMLGDYRYLYQKPLLATIAVFNEIDKTTFGRLR